MVNKRSSDVFDFKEKAVFVGSLIVFFLGAILWYNYLHRTSPITPEKLFEQAFVEPVSSVTDLEGDHSSKYGADFWIRFKSITPVYLRNPLEFKSSVAEVGRSWFAEKWPNDGSLHDAAA